ncbi:uncharacterized protein LOC122050318 [Zingiber officinale]|uniref:uncharacterized protein LOC122050318 n=1 Tax=Zingiber officinale TaxID=94328 RepID=UPI001C4BBBD1|nr:uncharacterized protein LOC122050318 [Zingiber officinale]
MASPFFFLFFLLISVSCFSVFPSSLAADSAAAGAAIPSGTILRKIKQQILATLPPNCPPNSAVPFLASPSGKFIASLVRLGTAPGAGGLGNDFCFIQVHDSATGAAAWESSCQPVSSANACSLVLCDLGIAVFDGSRDAWDTGADSSNNFPASLELVDLGDMRVIDKDGELVWKASDEPRVNQRCGLPGSPGLSTGEPPFVGPIGGRSNPPFGQTQPIGNNVINSGSDNQLPITPNPNPDTTIPLSPEPEPLAGDEGLAPAKVGFGQELKGLGIGAEHQQPLVDNSPYDSGSSRKEALLGLLFVALVLHLAL